MAFTNAELIRIRSVLGYPNAFRYKNVRLESALVQVDSDGETYIRGELAAILEIDTAIRTGGDAFDSIGLKKVDEIEFQSGTAASLEVRAKSLGRVHIGRISSFFGVNIHSDYYGTGGFPGDWWSGGISGNAPCAFEMKFG
jgi:hypothetical protein